jgi:hypothetical protein
MRTIAAPTILLHTTNCTGAAMYTSSLHKQLIQARVSEIAAARSGQLAGHAGTDRRASHGIRGRRPSGIRAVRPRMVGRYAH